MTQRSIEDYAQEYLTYIPATGRAEMYELLVHEFGAEAFNQALENMTETYRAVGFVVVTSIKAQKGSKISLGPKNYRVRQPQEITLYNPI